MATSTSTFPTLSVPAADDTMDMSSPANRHLDDDIEIDFDDPPGGIAPLMEDDQMLEDITRPATATDDMMDDDAQQGGISYEEEMQDDGVHLGGEIGQPDDDELIDYGDDEEAIVEDTEIAIAEEAPSITFEETDEAHLQEVLEVPTEQPDQIVENTTPVEHVSDEIAQLPESEATHGLDDPTYILSEESHVDPVTDAVSQGDAHDQSYDDYHEDEGTAEEGDADGQPQFVNTTYPAISSGPDTPTDTGLHPMIVRYRGLNIPLFKSKGQVDGLLKNDNMASVSLVDLMNDCRQQLHKRKLDVADSHSIVLAFDQLGLILSDESSSASATSLNEVLETYLQLHYNESWQDIEPLSMTISTQLKFSSTFNMLKNAAALGQGISDFSAARMDREGEFEQSYFEESGEWYEPTTDGHGEYSRDEGYEETAQDIDSNHLTTEPRDEAHDPTDLGQKEYEEDSATANHPTEPDQEYYYDETEQPDHVADPTEALEGLNALAGDSTHDVQTQDLEAEKGEGTAQSAVTEEHSASTASSTTIQGDQEPGTIATAGSKDQAPQPTAADKTISKYWVDEEELIDWDEESLTPDTSDSDALDQTLSTEYNAVHGEATQDADQQQPGSEDWITYEEAYEGEHEDHAHDQDGPNQHLGKDAYTNSRLDTQPNEHPSAEGEDEYHLMYQPQDEEDRFNTAHEGLGEGDLYEHGLEHTEYHEDAGETQQVEDEEEFDDTVLIHLQGDEEAHFDDEVPQQHAADDFEDEIDFGEDEDGEVHAEQQYTSALPLASTTNPTGVSASPRGKRSFNEIDGIDDGDLQRPEVKKAKPS